MSLLSTKSLSKNYAGLQAVNNVNFELPEGQVRALIGPNGAGKTTFVGMLSGRIESSQGTVFFDGNRLSVHENVALAARRVLNGSKSVIHKKIEEVLIKMHLADRAEQIAGDLSYGHQRLLEIGMGLAQSPRLFILDEPTQGLAESEIDNFIKLIHALSAETTILLIEHNMDVVMRTAHYITVLNFGETLAEGTPDEIRANDAVQAAYLGKT